MVEYFEIQEGWYGLVGLLISRLLKTDWNKEIFDVKEKFGGLRFYSEDANPLIVADCERLSFSVCEVCGNSGTHRKDRRWWKTLCKTHAK